MSWLILSNFLAFYCYLIFFKSSSFSFLNKNIFFCADFYYDFIFCFFFIISRNLFSFCYWSFIFFINIKILFVTIFLSLSNCSWLSLAMLMTVYEANSMVIMLHACFSRVSWDKRCQYCFHALFILFAVL